MIREFGLARRVALATAFVALGSIEAEASEYAATYACSQHRNIGHLGPFSWSFGMSAEGGKVTGTRQYVVATGSDSGEPVEARFSGLVHQDGTAEIAATGAHFKGSYTGKLPSLSGPMLADNGQPVRSCTLTLRGAPAVPAKAQ